MGFEYLVIIFIIKNFQEIKELMLLLFKKTLNLSFLMISRDNAK